MGWPAFRSFGFWNFLATQRNAANQCRDRGDRPRDATRDSQDISERAGGEFEVHDHGLFSAKSQKRAFGVQAKSRPKDELDKVDGMS